MRPFTLHPLALRPARLLALLALCFATACSADDAGSGGGASGGPGPGAAPPPNAPPVTAGPGATGVGQAGAQDFGLFRQILEAGQIPAPNTLDPLGFFAEHKLDYPAADCGQDVCMHGLLGVQRNLITGSTCTVVQIGLNSPIRLENLERPPMDLVLAIDTSGSMRGAPIDFVRRGLTRMLSALEPGDRIALVTYSDAAEVVIADARVDEDGAALDGAIQGIIARGATNIYDGLYTAFGLAAEQLTPGRQSRVILLSDGVATAGLESTDRLKALAEAYARLGIGLTTIGVGADFDVSAMRGLSEVGAGNFYFLNDPAAVEEVFADEVATFLVPVALDVEITLQVGQGYLLRGAYGTLGWTGGLHAGQVEIPSLFLAGRQTAAAPIEDGRRGGGGGILVELMPLRATNGLEQLGLVGTLAMTYTDPQTGERREQTIRVENPNDPGQVPDGGYFTASTAEKGFVMLNLLVGFQIAADLAYDADVGSAIGTLDALRTEVQRWLSTQAVPDPDVVDDLRYVDLFISNLQRVQNQTPVSRPPEPWPVD